MLFIGLWRKQNREGLAGITRKWGYFRLLVGSGEKKPGSDPARSTLVKATSQRSKPVTSKNICVSKNTSKHMNVSSQNIDSAIPGRYTVQAPYKAGAGIGVLELHTATIGALASFLLLQLSYTQIMVGWVGAPKGAPVSVCAGYANPAQFTTSEIGVSGGGSYPLHTEAAIMATVPTSPYLKIEVVNGKAVIFSLHVACHFKRMHQNIVDKIEYLNCSREFFTRNFIPGAYHIYGDSLRGYYITLDGLMMLQLGLSLRTMRYYESCIEAFHEAGNSLNLTAFRRNQWEARP
ncbi:TPA: ash family protein [Escherichia coli]